MRETENEVTNAADSHHHGRSDWQSEYLDRFYRSQPGWIDGTRQFHALIAAQPRSGGTLLDIGAGPANETTRYLSSLGPVFGIDVDEAVAKNAHLAGHGLIKDGRWPLPDASVALAVSDNVIEHVREPELYSSELRRVLVPGGRHVFRTPNMWHYVALTSKLTPHAFHRLVANRLRALPPDAHDPYPTFYRMNTMPSVRRVARAVGLDVVSLQTIEKEPSYGLFARPAFLAMVAYERLVNSTEALAPLRTAILGVLARSQ